ncbi:three-helix bundle dimerization domain-containing protein [Streptomyces spectabilis]|uniref:Arsenate reductase ArsC n=1 Tax=Streptomyces spectabilis TaxID=68270 RepID=A0A5P2WY39_STRST|nr:arsenate reductase ArsC [Streptomyces spectabilis]MBB5107346.1 protein-tyrosine-phosphatase [Streptomyces spectabilis]MCI3900037.1 arsenate reductase ArsC [Streptomyces spectabilis]QEV57667.1 arsenate reductase ArsC [Streptomyces spectabilis]GGV36989.1 low molecular weight phosphatase family protein [Streptomyces spectabilis]
MTAPVPPALPDARLAAGAARLAARHTGRFSVETVQALIADSYGRLAVTARVSTHLLVLAERWTAERLDALDHLRKRPRSEVPRVLFVCSHNAGRSQLAAALLAHRACGLVRVSSAGTTPAAAVEPFVAQVLTEAGVEPSRAFPKPLTDEAVRAADVVVTMGCGDACPVFPGKKYLDWALEDPAGKGVGAVRPIRDQIKGRVETLITEIDNHEKETPAAASSAASVPLPGR